MELRTCSRCLTVDPECEFPARSSMCKVCHRQYTRQHYQDNKQYYIDKAKKNMSAVKDKVRAEKEKPCADCGVSYPYYVMDFDHRSDKSFNISEKVHLIGWKKLKQEIDKCDVVCSNCHRVRTYNRINVSVCPLATNE